MFMDSFDEAGELQSPDFASIEINLVGGLKCIKLAVHYFSKNAEAQPKGGKIVIVGSLAGMLSLFLLGAIKGC
jgi:short-subunit dehydrogenase